MADLILGSTTVLSETSGTVTLGGLSTIGSTVTFPTGHIIQVVQTAKTSRFIAAGNVNEQLVTDYNCSITPAKAGSKILINYSFDTSASGTVTARSYMERNIGGGGYSKLAGIHGDDPAGSVGDPSLSHGGSNNNWMCFKHAGMFLDTPSYSLTNVITYRIGIQSENTSMPIYVGSTHRDSTGYHPRTASILLLMEVAQ